MKTEQATINGINITFEDKGPRDAPVILLVMGLGGQLTLWPDEFVDALNARGFRTIRYDNRDVGLSSRFDAAGVPNIKWMVVKSVLGLPIRSAYTLADMAADGMALLDHLGVERAHFAGVSLGGMVGQWLGYRAPERLSFLILANTSAYMGPPAGWARQARPPGYPPAPGWGRSSAGSCGSCRRPRVLRLSRRPARAAPPR